ncbi:MAG: hypothetical protein ACR2LP_06035 [Candidatus Limnocylindrales bacterium]
MTADTFYLVIALAAIALAVAALLIGRSVMRMAQDLRRLSESLDTELAPTLRQLRMTGEAAERSMAELTARLERVDAIADETQLTLARAREGIEAAVSIVRGPADVMEGARRTVQTVGGGLVSGADRLRRRMSREEEAAADL